MTRPVDVAEASACNAPPTPTDPAAPKLGPMVSRSALAETAPAKLADTKIRVMNASGQGGQAGEVAGTLRDLGFAAPTAANDPIYAGTRLTCQGQLRFGPTGRAEPPPPGWWRPAWNCIRTIARRTRSIW